MKAHHKQTTHKVGGDMKISHTFAVTCNMTNDLIQLQLEFGMSF